MSSANTPVSCGEATRVAELTAALAAERAARRQSQAELEQLDRRRREELERARAADRALLERAQKAQQADAERARVAYEAERRRVAEEFRAEEARRAAHEEAIRRNTLEQMQAERERRTAVAEELAGAREHAARLANAEAEARAEAQREAAAAEEARNELIRRQAEARAKRRQAQREGAGYASGQATPMAAGGSQAEEVPRRFADQFRDHTSVGDRQRRYAQNLEFGDAGVFTSPCQACGDGIPPGNKVVFCSQCEDHSSVFHERCAKFQVLSRSHRADFDELYQHGVCTVCAKCAKAFRVANGLETKMAEADPLIFQTARPGGIVWGSAKNAEALGEYSRQQYREHERQAVGRIPYGVSVRNDVDLEGPFLEDGPESDSQERSPAPLESDTCGV